MKKELQDKLKNTYPSLFYNDKFYFECGDGWYEILVNLFSSITQHEKTKLPKLTQVKEKFGRLRVYCDYETPTVSALIHFAEGISWSICEICGNRGTMTTSGWMRVLCSECACTRLNNL